MVMTPYRLYLCLFLLVPVPRMAATYTGYFPSLERDKLFVLNLSSIMFESLPKKNSVSAGLSAF
jgi:hypothetical protein